MKKMQSRISRFKRLQEFICALGLLAVMLFSGCSDSLDIEEFDPSRVVPAKRVDGINLGDSKERVEKMLGISIGHGGIADGLYASWRTYHFDEGTLAGLHIYFREQLISKELGYEAGPVDILSMREEYSGTTRNGIGIGTPLSVVREIHGTPWETRQNSSGSISDVYCFNNQRHFTLVYRDSIVQAMSIGNYIPLPGSSCELRFVR